MYAHTQEHVTPCPVGTHPSWAPPCHITSTDTDSASTWLNRSHHEAVSGRFRCHDNMAAAALDHTTQGAGRSHTHTRVWKHASQPPVPMLLGHSQSRAQCAVCATTIQAPSTTITQAMHVHTRCRPDPPWHPTPSKSQKHLINKGPETNKSPFQDAATTSQCMTSHNRKQQYCMSGSPDGARH